MVEITIDGKRCDLWEGYALPRDIFKFDVATMADIQQQRSGRSVELHLPSSPANDAIFGYASDPCCGERFNASHHEAAVVVDGVELMRGVAHLMAMECKDGVLNYVVRLRSGGSDWVEEAALTPLAETVGNYSATLNGKTILASWINPAAPVRFLPVLYDDYRVPYDEHSLYPPQRVMTVGDYYPFLSIERLLREAVERGGYTLAGEWVKSEEFRSLMMSGKYASVGGQSLSRLKSFAGFEAGRSSSAECVADGQGRAWLSPLVLTSSLGALVDTVEGEELYSNNNCLTISDKGVVYKPATAVTVGFEYYLKYTTDYEILSRKRLKCFDSIYLGEGCDMEFQVANPFNDKRDNLQPNMEYHCIVFDHQEGARYRLTCYHGSSHSVVANQVGERFSFTAPQVDAGSMNCVLMKIASNGVASVYSGDWAVYEGHVGFTGQTTVELTIQSPPELVSPSSGRSFNHLYLHGAAEGQRVRLSDECRMRPIFSATPALGSKLTFGDVAAHDVQLIDVVEAVQQMYNLRIFTDEASKRVYVEPRDDFYRDDEHDWSDRVDLSQPIEVEDLAAGERERFTLSYRTEGDGAVARFNHSAESPLGEWTAQIDSRITSRGEYRHANPLFTPTLNSAPYASAPSAQVMQVGNRDADQVATVSARIVRYKGLRDLPDGENWGFPSYGQDYPFAAFHAPDEFTLCFEDRDGVKGLHCHYDEQMAELSLRRRVRLTLRLMPDELLSLAEWDGAEANLRSVFVLNISGQRAKYRLEAVENYEAATGRAVCRFVRQMKD
ncbi:MAG: hypothetical protein IKV33_02415 [Alistipes sp.]|nr:hypothetical protein [Alistipes sp.]